MKYLMVSLTLLVAVAGDHGSSVRMEGSINDTFSITTIPPINDREEILWTSFTNGLNV